MPAVIRMLPMMRRWAPRLRAGYSSARVRTGPARAKRSRRLMLSSAEPTEDLVKGSRRIHSCMTRMIVQLSRMPRPIRKRSRSRPERSPPRTAADRTPRGGTRCATIGTRVRPAPTLRQMVEAAVSALWSAGRGRSSSRVWARGGQRAGCVVGGGAHGACLPAVCALVAGCHGASRKVRRMVAPTGPSEARPGGCCVCSAGRRLVIGPLPPCRR